MRALWKGGGGRRAEGEKDLNKIFQFVDDCD